MDRRARAALGRLAAAWPRAAVPAAFLSGAVVGLGMALGAAPMPGDAMAYWLNRPGEYALGAYGYPPALSQLLAPLRAAGLWMAFTVAWESLCMGSLGYLGGRWWPLLALPALPALYGLPASDVWSAPVASVLTGNVTMPMAAAIVLAVDRPALWAVPLLTKATPGVGVLWHLFRREWRALGAAVASAAGIALLLAAVDPGAWLSFAGFALANTGASSFGPPIVGPPLWARCAGGAALVWWGARSGRAWVLPLAGAAALPGMYGPGVLLSVALGSLRLRGRARGQMTLNTSMAETVAASVPRWRPKPM